MQSVALPPPLTTGLSTVFASAAGSKRIVRALAIVVVLQLALLLGQLGLVKTSSWARAPLPPQVWSRCTTAQAHVHSTPVPPQGEDGRKHHPRARAAGTEQRRSTRNWPGHVNTYDAEVESP